MYFFVGMLFVFLVAAPCFAGETTGNTDNTTAIADLENKLQTTSGKKKMAILFQLLSMIKPKSADKTIAYCKEIIELADLLNDPSSKSRALLKMSTALMTKGEIDQSIKTCKKGLAIYGALGDKRGEAVSLNHLGMLYINSSYYHIAQDYLLKALRIREKLGEKKPLFYSNLYLGTLYLSLDNYSKAMVYFQAAMTLATQLGNDKRIMVCTYYTGVCHLKLKQTARAMEYLERTLALAQQQGMRFYIAAALNWIGNIHGQQGRYALALTELERARGIQEKFGFKGKLIYNYHFTGNIYTKTNDFQQAAHYYDLTLALAEELQDKQAKEQAYKEYALMFARTGDYRNAYLYYKKHAQTRALILDEKRVKQMSEMEMQFESEKRLKEIELLKREGRLRKITRNTSMVILFLVLIILFLVFKKYLYLLAFWKTQKYIGQYRIINKIGSGGMGTVYLVHPANDKKKRIAVKALRDELLEDENSRRRFKHEGAIIDKLEHPNIVKFHERGDSKGKLYIAMEYLDGLPLAKKIKQDGLLDITTCLHIMKQTASALAFIHENNVVHRDIKPANIMLLPEKNGKYRVKLLDFGVALTPSHTRLTESGILVGTINYLAPEQITQNLYTPAGDIYAMGVTFYEMVTGKPPFPKESVTSVIEAILDTPPPEPATHRPGIPGELNRMISSMLAKKPGRRPTARDVSKVFPILGVC
jgi:tetratricopeptide (TPR) repeat protein